MVTMELLNKLVFSNNMYLYLLAFIFLPILVFYKSKVFTNKTYNLEFLSKPATNCIKGLCILVIILHHITQNMESPFVMNPFNLFGYLAVSIFFFLSGYGLMVSALNKSDYLHGFFLKRLSKVYLPFVLVNAITLMLIYLLSNDKYSINETIAYILGIKLIDPSLWFVKAIILFYVIFYLAFKFFTKNIASKLVLIYSFIYFAVCYKIGLGGWWFNTCFCFPMGVYLALYYNKFIKFIQENYVKTTIVNMIFFAITFFFSQQSNVHGKIIFETISSVFFVALTLTFLLKVKISSKPLYFIGGISYEMYIIHMKVLGIYFNSVNISESYSTYIYFILVVLIAFFLNKIMAKTPHIFNKNKGVLAKPL
jgi:probable poly-beta-1,6-N-acetyl-D-glucosamine export protein